MMMNHVVIRMTMIQIVSIQANKTANHVQRLSVPVVNLAHQRCLSTTIWNILGDPNESGDYDEEDDDENSGDDGRFNPMSSID